MIWYLIFKIKPTFWKRFDIKLFYPYLLPKCATLKIASMLLCGVFKQTKSDFDGMCIGFKCCFYIVIYTALLKQKIATDAWGFYIFRFNGTISIKCTKS